MANWGFIGAGSIAESSLAPAVRAADGAVLHSVASTSRRRAGALHPQRTYAAYDDLLQDPHVEIVYIALHNSAHRQWVERALEAGKHVLCEKPLGLTTAEVDAMIHASQRAGRLLVEAAWNRWHPRTRDLETMIGSQAIGDVRSVVAYFDGLAPAKGNYRFNASLGGGALYDVGYYAVSAALAAFGWATPRVLWAKQEQWHHDSADSLTEFLLEFPGQGTAEIRCSLVGAMEETLAVTGTDGTLTLSSPAFCAGAAPARLLTDGNHPERHYPAVDPYRLMVEAVDAAVAGRPSPYLVPLEQSRLIAATVDTVRKQLLCQGTPDA